MRGSKPTNVEQERQRDICLCPPLSPNGELALDSRSVAVGCADKCSLCNSTSIVESDGIELNPRNSLHRWNSEWEHIGWDPVEPLRHDRQRSAESNPELSEPGPHDEPLGWYAHLAVAIHRRLEQAPPER